MAGGYVQESYWEDMVVGAPEHVFGTTEAGAATLTRAVATAACTEVDGYWEAKDYFGNTVTIKLFNDDSTGELKFTFEDDYWFAAIEDYGLSTQRQCQQDVDDDPFVVEWADSIYKIDTGVTLALPHLWQGGGAPDEIWVDVDAAPIAAAAFGESVPAGLFYGTFEMELVSSTELTWAFALDASMIDLGFGLSGMDDAVNCEPVPLSGTLENPVLALCE